MALTKIGLPVAALTLMLAACGDNAEQTAAGTEATPAATPAAGVTAQPGDWVNTIVATPEGGFRIGNPDAPVKLIEFGSLWCTHCRDFHKDALPLLKNNYIASGKVSYELRNFILNAADLPTSLLARCQGSSTFFPMVDAFYENHETWTKAFMDMPPAEMQRLNTLPQDQQILALANAVNLDDFMRLRGMPSAKYQQCLTDTAQIEKLTAIRNDAITTHKLAGTPLFVINGTPQDGAYDWKALKPRLDAAVG